MGPIDDNPLIPCHIGVTKICFDNQVIISSVVIYVIVGVSSERFVIQHVAGHGELICPGTACELISAITNGPGDRVGTCIAFYIIVALSTVDNVVAIPTDDFIVALSTVDNVVAIPHR